MNFGMSTTSALRGEFRIIHASQRLLNPINNERRVLNVVSSNYKTPPPQIVQQKGDAAQHVCSKKDLPTAPTENEKPCPIWKRRGANPVPALQFNPLIRSDIDWMERVSGTDDQLQIVYDTEWQALQPNYFQVHSLKDVEDGVVINPPTYPAWYGVPSTASMVQALLPNGHQSLLRNALQQGYSLDTLIYLMGNAIINYSSALIHPKRRFQQEILVLARSRSWQGASAISAATRLLRDCQMRVSVFVHEPTNRIHNPRTKEEAEFIAAGGSIYRHLEDLNGRKFRVVVVALEDQYSGRKSDLSRYGELLQHAVAILVDPPVLKCSYITALQFATGGCYNICQRTLLLVPFLPKPYIPDSFVEIIVVDGGITEYIQQASGVTHTIFPRSNGSYLESVVPIEYTVKGSRLYFYRDGKRV